MNIFIYLRPPRWAWDACKNRIRNRLKLRKLKKLCRIPLFLATEQEHMGQLTIWNMLPVHANILQIPKKIWAQRVQCSLRNVFGGELVWVMPVARFATSSTCFLSYLSQYWAIFPHSFSQHLHILCMNIIYFSDFWMTQSFLLCGWKVLDDTHLK
jgi:hypothetical protein